MYTKVMVIILSLSNVHLEDFRSLDVPGLIKLAGDISNLSPIDLKHETIKFFLHTRINGTILDETVILSNQTEQDENVLDPNLPIKVLVHGYIQNYKHNWYHDVTQELLEHSDCTVVQVDWQHIAHVAYVTSVMNAKFVGTKIADLFLKYHIPMENIHLIGHSLGAHVAGFAAKSLQKASGTKVYRVSGLDPAGPLFEQNFLNPEDRLSSEDGKIVDIFHTDGGFYGYENPIGTLDMYFNGGTRIQPGCMPSFKIFSLGDIMEDGTYAPFLIRHLMKETHYFVDVCSHTRSTVYFAEAINHGKIKCTKCPNWISFKLGMCSKLEVYIMSVDEITEEKTGICFAETKSKPPFLAN